MSLWVRVSGVGGDGDIVDVYSIILFPCLRLTATSLSLSLFAYKE